MKRTNRPRSRLTGAMALVAALATAGAGPLAAVSPAAAGAMPADEKTWVGDVMRHGRHYDYLGRSCAIEDSEPCPEYTVKYGIVPTTAQAARALARVDGTRARLIGHKEALRKPGHSGMLMVSEVQSKRARPGPLEREP